MLSGRPESNYGSGAYTGCVTQGKLCNLSELLPLPLKSGDGNGAYLVEHARHKEQQGQGGGSGSLGDMSGD